MVSLEQRVEHIDAALPQTQCQQCGYPRCRDYALALAHGNTDINRCPPGGNETIQRLARLLNTAVLALDTTLGEHRQAVVARIREHECIGCTLCIQVCPTDAIIGSGKLMHTVVADDCTGCELCLPVCPVDCIDTPLVKCDDNRDVLQAQQPTETANHNTPGLPPDFAFYSHEQVAHYRSLTERRITRLINQSDGGAKNTNNRLKAGGTAAIDKASIREDIAAAVARRRAQRTTH